jgi:Na+-translocating ferredoxin:NAD+ oxidoreductase RnfG subunit
VHNVRTKPEAFLIVLTPAGDVRSVRILAFHEPLDYLPTDSWYGQFEGRRSTDRLRVGGDIHGVVGATLSARAAADGVRRMLAYWEVLLRPAAVSVQEP